MWLKLHNALPDNTTKMMLIAWILLATIVAYLLGSIPTAVWVGQQYFGIDVRQHGSKNAGATNTFRVLGRKAGITVLFIDSLKGFLAALGPMLLVYLDLLPVVNLVQLQLVCGIAAIIGHIFPIFAGFKGGKGVATLAGMMLAIHPTGVGVCVLIFLLTLIVFGYVSLGSMVGALAFPVLLVTRALGDYDGSLFVFGLIMAVGIVYTHKKNIGRLLKGEETKTYLWGGGRPKCNDLPQSMTDTSQDS